MYETFTQWLLKIPQTFGEFGSWLTNPIADAFPIAPLALFGIGGISAIIIMKAVRLFIGG